MSILSFLPLAMTPRPVESIELEGRSTACSCVDIIEDEVVFSEHSATAHTGSLGQASSADSDSDNADREQDVNLPPADRGIQAWCFVRILLCVLVHMSRSRHMRTSYWQPLSWKL